MVGLVNRRASATLAFVVPSLIIAWASLAGFALAADLPDPTRPPLSQRRALPPEQVAVSKAPVLQSILTGAGRKPAVIINGQALELGDTVDGLRLMRVTDAGAVLVGPHGTTTLALTPASERLAAEPPRDAPVVTATARPRAGSTAAITLRTADPK